MLTGGIAISGGMKETIASMESLKSEACNLPLIFAEMFKDEVNANDELRMFNGVMRIIKKYSGDAGSIGIINEFTGVITGGATLEEILQITCDEAVNPTLASKLVTDESCRLKKDN